MIFFSTEAISDSQRVYEFLESKNPGAAARAMSAIWAKLELLEHMPGLGHKTRSPRIRQITVQFGKRGYVVRYTIREADGALLILRIWHGREIRK
ncbi:MAG TPA: type II toxin-antitoxin system RelE/ParE family toxin [Rhizomicrobium sp.]|nr:type II toxin-antitoxin system RelE/ParE family toxin [Rhizomicrobium sp.]